MEKRQNLSEKKYRILQICVDLDGGGIDRYLYNYCTRIDSIHFDFVKVDRGIIGFLEPILEARGSNIYSVPRQNGHVWENYAKLKDIITNGHYDAVHVHLGYMGFIALLCAKNCGVKTRIVHAHTAYEPESFKMKLKRVVFTILTRLFATNLAACGIDAAIWMWGKKTYENGKSKVINNAIETERFTFNEAIRIAKRQQMGVGNDTIVLGNVGRVGPQKNQLRLLEIFAEYKKMNSNSELWLVGNREYPDDVWYNKVSELKLVDSVKMLGVRKDVPELLNAMDVFVFPSVYEGLPFTLVETQCNGLPALSSTAVTKHVKFTDEIEYLSLKDSDMIWVNNIDRLAKRGHNPQGAALVYSAGYDIEIESQKLKQYYIDLISTNN